MPKGSSLETGVSEEKPRDNLGPEYREEADGWAETIKEVLDRDPNRIFVIKGQCAAWADYMETLFDKKEYSIQRETVLSRLPSRSNTLYPINNLTIRRKQNA